MLFINEGESGEKTFSAFSFTEYEVRYTKLYLAIY